MFDQHHSAKQARRFACVAGLRAASMRRSALALACCLLAGCAASGAGPSPMADDHSAPPKAEPAATASGSAGSPTAAALANPVLMQRRRQAIAGLLDSSSSYRLSGPYAGDLVDAKLSAPFDRNIKPIFLTPQIVTAYCASARLVNPHWLDSYWITMIEIEPADKGSEKLTATTYVGGPRDLGQCAERSYAPFPELEQVRAKQRPPAGTAG